MSELDEYGHLIEQAPEISEAAVEQLEDDLAREQDMRDRMWDRADYEWSTE